MGRRHHPFFVSLIPDAEDVLNKCLLNKATSIAYTNLTHPRVFCENTNHIYVQNTLYILNGCPNGYLFNHDHIASKHSIPYLPSLSCSFSLLILEIIIFI